MLGYLKNANKHNTTIDTAKGNYYYHLYAMYYIQNDCSQFDFDVYNRDAHDLQTIFKTVLQLPYVYCLFINLFFDVYMGCTRSESMYKYTLIVPLMYAPFLGIIIYFIVEGQINLLKAPECFGIWTAFL